MCRDIFLQRTRLIVRSQWAKQWKLSIRTCPRTSEVAHGRVLVSQNGAESYRGQSSWSVVLLGRRDQSLWSFILFGRRGQTSRSVALPG